MRILIPRTEFGGTRDARTARYFLPEQTLHVIQRGNNRDAINRALFDTPLEPEFVESVCAATNGGWALGDERFKRQIAQALGRRVEKLPPGRPQKETDDKRQIKLL